MTFKRQNYKITKFGIILTNKIIIYYIEIWSSKSKPTTDQIFDLSNIVINS